MYATHLATGSTLHCRSIKASTIASYLHDVSTFLGRFRPIDPRYISATDTKLAPVIAKVLDEQRRWETVLNRQEPFTIELHKEIASLPSVASDPNGLDAAMANWTICMLYAGCRGIEWSQTSSANRYLSTFFRNQFQNAYAFTLADVHCFTATSVPVSVADAIATPSLVGKIKLRFEQQKNNQNGEVRLFTRNVENASLCFIENFIAILKRHKLLTNSSPIHPLSVYRAPDGVAYNIISADVERAIRRAAATLYKLDPVRNRAQLALWSSHSLRVGACTILYSQGFSGEQIQHLLRWQSTAFMIYLRNLAVTSRQQNVAINDSSAIPNFI